MAHQHEEPTPLAAFRPELPARLGRIVQQLMAKRPEDRCDSPTELLRAVEAVEAVLTPRSRHDRLPLAWEGEVVDWSATTTPAGLPRAAVTLAGRGSAPTARLREATRHLQEAADREAGAREAWRAERSRRGWIVALAAVAALAAGFAIGRRRRRSELFRLRP
ncbi:MAG: hypothetical protein ACKOK8_17305 [Planctomycetia bacterium]